MTQTLTLKLTNIRDAAGLDKPEELVNAEAMRRFLSLIRTFVGKANEYDCQLEKTGYPDERNSPLSRVYQTISVIGGRGSGKTTFLLSAFHLVNTLSQKRLDEFIDRPSAANTNGLNVEILEVLDPTLIEHKDHVLVNIISRIKQRVDRRMMSGEGSSDFDERNRGAYRDWQHTLQRMAEGMCLLEGIGGSNTGVNQDAWADPVFVMEKGLTQVKAANQLERNFHSYVHQSLKILGKDAFILAFDDIDTRFCSGWQVLEVIRKYLTSPQLITVIAGDLRLYSMLIRKNQWEHFDSKMLDIELQKADAAANDGPSHSKYRTFTHMVDHLEDQYFLKILRSKYRLRLKTLYEVTCERKCNVETTKDETLALTNYIDELLKEHWFLISIE